MAITALHLASCIPLAGRMLPLQGHMQAGALLSCGHGPLLASAMTNTCGPLVCSALARVVALHLSIQNSQHALQVLAEVVRAAIEHVQMLAAY